MIKKLYDKGSKGPMETQENQQQAGNEEELTQPEEALEQTDENLAEQLEAAQSEAAEHKDRYMRLLADMENLRKRHEKERSDLLKYGSEKMLSELLPVLDSFEQAIHSESNEINLEAVIEGVKMVHKQLMSVLEKHGLKAFESQGQTFDPNLHQAIQRVESDVEEDTVHQEFQKGYQLNERLLRPAMVSVAVPGATKKD